MAEPFTHSPAKVLWAYLIAVGTITDPADGAAWQGFVSNEPDTPDNVVTLYNTLGVKQGRTHPDGKTQYHPGVQVRVRGLTEDVAHAKASEICTAFDAIAYTPVWVGTSLYTVHAVTRESGPIGINKQVPSSKRSLFTINVTLSMVESSLLTSLAAFWRLADDGSDSSGNGKHLTNSGAVTFDGESATFNGFNSLSRTPALVTSGPISIALWFNPGTPTSSQALAGQFNPSFFEDRPSLAAGGAGANSYRWTYDGSSSFTVTAPVASAWQHVVATHDRSAFLFYRNGLLVASDVGVLDCAGANVLKLGATAFSSGQYVGSMKLAGVWGRALRPAEVAKLATGFDPTA